MGTGRLQFSKDECVRLRATINDYTVKLENQGVLYGKSSGNLAEAWTGPAAKRASSLAADNSTMYKSMASDLAGVKVMANQFLDKIEATF